MAHQVVRQEARQQHPAESGQEGNGGQETGFNKVQPPKFYQISREPGEKEDEGGAQAELPQVNALELAVHEGLPQIGQGKIYASRICGAAPGIHQPAAASDQSDFLRIRPAVAPGIAVGQVPDDRPNETHHTGEDE